MPGYGGPDSGQTQSVRPRRSTGLKVVVVILAIVMVLALVGFFGIRWLAPETGTVPADVSGEPTSQAPSPSDELVQPSASPEEELDGFVESGAEKAAALEGQWVTQVSAKQVGTEADGKTWSAQDILDEFKANQVKYPGAILLDSSEWEGVQDRRLLGHRHRYAVQGLRPGARAVPLMGSRPRPLPRQAARQGRQVLREEQRLPRQVGCPQHPRRRIAP